MNPEPAGLLACRDERLQQKIADVGDDRSEREHHQKRQQLQEHERTRTAFKLQPDCVQNTDLVLVFRACVVNQLKDHRRAYKRDRHRHKDH